jgi:hypothetical protein
MPACGRAEQCHIVPSPLAGEGQGEGYNTQCVSYLSPNKRKLACY